MDLFYKVLVVHVVIRISGLISTQRQDVAKMAALLVLHETCLKATQVEKVEPDSALDAV